jgi:tripartite-type tricarboxylate transporter receptor subunit TctC
MFKPLALALAATAVLATPFLSHAEDKYPSKPVKIIVP